MINSNRRRTTSCDRSTTWRYSRRYCVQAQGRVTLRHRSSRTPNGTRWSLHQSPILPRHHRRRQVAFRSDSVFLIVITFGLLFNPSPSSLFRYGVVLACADVQHAATSHLFGRTRFVSSHRWYIVVVWILFFIFYFSPLVSFRSWYCESLSETVCKTHRLFQAALRSIITKVCSFRFFDELIKINRLLLVVMLIR